MGIKESPKKDDDILRDHLEKDDLLEFDKTQSKISSLFHLDDLEDLQVLEEQQDKKKLKCLPPVKIFVGNIPLALNSNGLRNIFSKFGDLLEVSKPRPTRDGQHSFGFVTFASPKSAVQAISRLNDAKPLFLKVQHARSQVSKTTNLERQMTELQTKFNKSQDHVDDEDDDWEKEMKEKEEMLESVEKFTEDYNSSDSEDDFLVNNDKEKLDDEASVSVASLMRRKSAEKDEEIIDATEKNIDQGAEDNLDEDDTKRVVNMCGRCRKPDSGYVCGGCSSIRYCSGACQRLDWPRHKNTCAKKKKRDSSSPETTSIVRNQEPRNRADADPEDN